MVKFPLSGFFLILISACHTETSSVNSAGNTPAPEIKTVIVPCVEGRPNGVVPLNKQFPPEVWQKLSHKQQTTYVGRQVVAYAKYGQDLDVATKSCQDVDTNVTAVASDAVTSNTAAPSE